MKNQVGRPPRARRSDLLWAAVAASAATMASLPEMASAQTSQWVGGTSTWSTPANWNPSGVPGANATADVTSTLGLTQTITYNYTGTAQTLLVATINLTGGNGTASEILSMSGDTFAAVLENVGGYLGTAFGGRGTFNQSGGYNQFGNQGLNLGYNSGDSGTYLLTAGTLMGDSQEVVGDGGTGLFNQTGGFNELAGGAPELFLAGNSGSTGTYLLSAGSLTISGFEYIGDEAVGIFNQSGGTHTLTNANGTLAIGVQSGANGTYLLSQGSLSNAGSETIGGNSSAVGLFNQSGGTHSLTNSKSVLSIASAFASSGAYLLSAGSFSTAGSEEIGNGGAGTFNQSGGLNTLTNASGTFALGNAANSSGIYLLSGGTLSLAGNEYVGMSGAGTFNETGGTNSIGGGQLYIGYNATGTGTFLLTTGSFSTAQEFVGYSGMGAFNQSGGTNSLPSNPIYVGYNAGSNGSYSLGANSTLSVLTSPEYVGYGGAGTFNQSGGDNAATDGLLLANNPGSTGTYVMSGASTLSTRQLYVGNGGTGVFNQNGGTVTIATGPLNIADNAGSTGSFALSAGTLSTLAAPEYIGNSGTGLFNQSGGLNTIVFTQGLFISDSAGSTGTYLLSGTGSLSTSAEMVGYTNAGLFNQSGGSNTINTDGQAVLLVGDDTGVTGTYMLSGTGILSAPNEYIGNIGSGIFNQTGGSNTVDDVFAFGYGGGTGTYLLSATGTLTSPLEYTGNNRGLFNQSGGSNIVTKELDVGYEVGASDTYLLSGGTLSVSGGVYIAGGGPNVGNTPGGTGTLVVSGTGNMSVTGMLKIWPLGRVTLGVANTSVGTLSIVGTGLLNLNGGLDINYGSPAGDPTSTILSYLNSGYKGGTWTGTAGIVSTVAAASSSPLMSLGYADGNVDVGTAAAANQVLVKFTLAGDALLNGTVNFNDLDVVGRHLNTSGNDWANGNFNYDPNGAVNFNDLDIVGQNLNKNSGAAVELGGSTIPLGQVAAVQNTIVTPEPGAVVLIVSGAAGLLARRRRKRHIASAG
jgi:hypothetical protein